MAELRADPALSPLLDDPKVAAAIKDIAANPAALQKHASNAKVGSMTAAAGLADCRMPAAHVAAQERHIQQLQLFQGQQQRFCLHCTRVTIMHKHCLSCL